MTHAADPPRQAGLIAVATDALRWVAEASVETEDGMAWPQTRTPGEPLVDHLYAGTAGVLVAFAEAHLTGIADFDDEASAAASRLHSQVLASLNGDDDTDLSLYTGSAGMIFALDSWAQANGDSATRGAARDLAVALSRIAAAGPVTPWRDVISGDAGILFALIALGGPAAEDGAARTADRLVAAVDWVDGLPDWYAHPEFGVFMPNFSHGAAGIGCALAAASRPLNRPDLLELAEGTARRLISLGGRPDGTLAVPSTEPLVDPDAPLSYGWCHGPTGTVRLFEILDRELPGDGWADWADACRRAVRGSGLPERKYPGFWDNIGQCCGTAGVAGMALDHHRASADPVWLAWAADELTEDILDRRMADQSGVRWSHTEHTLPEPQLEPAVGWMHGAAGIAGGMLRLARVQRDGVNAETLRWPDNPGSGRPA